MDLNNQVLDKPEDITPEPPQLTEVETQAMQSGWVPKEEWKGAEDDWVPAKQFVKYGQVEAELKRQRAEVSQKEKVIKSMKDHYLNVKEDAKKEVIDTLKRSHRDAVKAEDYVEATKITLQIEEMEDKLDQRFIQHDRKIEEVSATTPAPSPEFYEWQERNGWYKLGNTNDDMTVEADEMAVAFARKNPNKSYTDMLNHVTDKIKKLYPEKFMTKEKEPVNEAVNEPGSVISKPDGKNKPRLTAAEKEAAAAFGLTEQEFAESLKEYDSKKGRI